MFNHYTFPKQKTYVIADNHGKFNKLKFELNKIKNCILIIAGDCGIGFRKEEEMNEYLLPLSEKCVKRNIQLLALRGNHDNPFYYNKKQLIYKNFMTIPDYSIITVGTINILCVGGAISHDRKSRNFFDQRKLEDLMEKEKISEEEASKKINRTYWPDEIPFYDEKILDEIYNKNILITHVITHTSPDFCFRKGLEKIKLLLLSDPPLEKDINESRKVLTNVYNHLIKNKHPIKTWTFGHFHESNKEIINGITFICLINADNFFEYISLETEK